VGVNGRAGARCRSVVGHGGRQRLVVVAAGHNLVVMDRKSAAEWSCLVEAALPFPL
jgi:hypothetical protein